MKNHLLIACLALSLLGCDNGTQIPKPEPGKQVSQTETATNAYADKFTTLKAPLPGDELGASEPYVVEFFWFGCSHCYGLEPLVKAFRQGNPDIQFIPVAAAPNQRWEIEARIYYAMEALGIEESHVDQVFELYNELREVPRYPSLDEVANLFSDAGVSKDDLVKQMGSEEVSIKIERSKRLFKQAELTGVPSLVVNGKYHLDFAKLSGDQFTQDFMETIRARALNQ